MTFQQYVLIVAGGVFIVVVLVLVYMRLFVTPNKEKDISWPPTVSNCPDYWEDIHGDGSACHNRHSLGTCNIPSSSSNNSMNFSADPYVGPDSKCKKYTWAKNCGVAWDGITYGSSSNPCTV